MFGGTFGATTSYSERAKYISKDALLYNCCVSGCTNNFRNVLFIFCPSKQATRSSPLLDWEMANWTSLFTTFIAIGLLGFTFFIGPMTDVLAPDIYIELTGPIIFHAKTCQRCWLYRYIASACLKVQF
jgi:hypothetical protein